MRWTEKWLNCHSKSLVISDRKSIRMPATYRVPQGSVLSQRCLTISLMTWTTECILRYKTGRKCLYIRWLCCYSEAGEMGHWFFLSAKKMRSVLAAIRENAASKMTTGEATSAVLCPPLGSPVQEDMTLPEWVHWLTMKTAEGIFRDWSI